MSKKKGKIEPKMLAAHILSGVGALFLILWLFLTLIPIIQFVATADLTDDQIIESVLRIIIDPFFFLMLIPLAIGSQFYNEIKLRDAPPAPAAKSPTQTYYAPQAPSAPAAPVKEVIIKEKKIMHVLPSTCPNCGGKISEKDVRWVGPMRAACPYCEGDIFVEEREM